MNRIIFWIVFGIIKIGLFLYLSHLTICSTPERALGKYAFTAGDTFSYTGAMENFIQEGSYYFHNGKEKVFAGRLPHYAIPYFVLRLFFEQRVSYDLLVFFQLGIEIIASILFIMFISSLFKSTIATVLGYLMLLFSTNWTSFSYCVSPESMSISFLIIFLYFYQQYLQLRNSKRLFVAGVFLAFLVVLKNYYILVYLFIGIEFIFHYKLTWHQFLKIAKDTLVVSCVLIALLIPWIIRNQIQYNKFVPLQINTTAGYGYSESDFACRRFVTAWGGDIVHWEKSSAGSYFIPSENVESEFVFPDYVFTESYGLADIEQVRNAYIELNQDYNDKKDAIVAGQFDELYSSFKSEKPFRFYVISPLILLKIFLINSGSYYLPIHKTNACFFPMQWPIKLFQSALYWFSIIIGFIGIWILTFRKKINAIFLFVVLLILLLFPIVFRLVEWRYFRTVQPILVLGVVHFISPIVEKIILHIKTLESISHRLR